MRFIKKNRNIVFFLCFLYSFSYATDPIKLPLFFYSSPNQNKTQTVTLAEDLFFTQLQSLNIFVVNDKRSTAFSEDILKVHENSHDILFYADLSEQDKQWISTLHIIDSKTQKQHTANYTYAGYYKILMDAKTNLQSLISEFQDSTIPPQPIDELITSKPSLNITLEHLSGSWYGEESIEKIILLRGGRGFIIFKNGASMNIHVTITQNEIHVNQESKSNASFFPEIPREIALVSALTAPPVLWKFTAQNEKELVGIKQTLMVDENQKVFEGTIPVRWHR